MKELTPPEISAQKTETIWSKLLGSLSGLIAIFIGGLFLVGYYLNSYYFSEMGIQALSPLRIQYILTGSVFSFFLLAPCLGLFGATRLAWECHEKVISKIVAWLFMMVAYYFIITFILNGITEKDSLLGNSWSIYWDCKNSVNTDPRWFLAAAIISWFLFFNLGLFIAVLGSMIPQRGNGIAGFFSKILHSKVVMLISLGLGFTAGGYYYAITVHPQIEAAFGGAVYSPCHLAVSLKPDNLILPKTFEKHEDFSEGDVSELYEDEKWFYFYVSGSAKPATSKDAAENAELTKDNVKEVSIWRIPKDRILSTKVNWRLTNPH